MKITPEFLSALELAINDSGSIYKLAKELGISHSTIFFWRTGRTINIHHKTWAGGLRKKLKPSLSNPPGAPSQDEPEEENGMNLVKEPRALYGERPRAYPLVTFRKLAYFDPNVRSTSSFVQAYSLGSFYFVSDSGITAFALRMDESVSNEIFKEGSTLLVECGRPPFDGELVLVKSKELPQAQLYTFKHEEDSYCLVPFGSKEATVLRWELTASSSTILDWIYPVLEANIHFCK